MPVSFLTHRERARYSRFPAEILPEDLSAYFTLSPSDLTEVYSQRGHHNRLGFALQLCTLRYLGFVPDDLSAAPTSVITHLAGQVGAHPGALENYGRRERTRSDHYALVQAHLGFHRATEEDLRLLTAWLVAAALEHDRLTLLFQMEGRTKHNVKRIGARRWQRWAGRRQVAWPEI
jgi:TnpA family transposase